MGKWRKILNKLKSISNKRAILQHSLINGSVVSAFLVIFKPFGINHNSWQVNLYLIGFGFITFLFTFLSEYFVVPIINRYTGKPSFWTMVLCNTLFIAMANILYVWYMTSGGASPIQEYLNILLYTLAVALIPFSVLIIFQKNSALKEKKYKLEELKQKYGDLNHSKYIKLRGLAKIENLNIPIDKVLYLKSEDNYTSIHLTDHKHIMFRGSLNHFELQFKDTPILRCHRSYMVNTGHGSQIIKKNRRYEIKMNDFELTLPVSKEMSKIVLQALHANSSQNL